MLLRPEFTGQHGLNYHMILMPGYRKTIAAMRLIYYREENVLIIMGLRLFWRSWIAGRITFAAIQKIPASWIKTDKYAFYTPH